MWRGNDVCPHASISYTSRCVRNSDINFHVTHQHNNTVDIPYTAQCLTNMTHKCTGEREKGGREEGEEPSSNSAEAS